MAHFNNIKKQKAPQQTIDATRSMSCLNPDN